MVFGDGTKEKAGDLAGSAQVTDSRWFGHVERRDRKNIWVKGAGVFNN